MRSGGNGARRVGGCQPGAGESCRRGVTARGAVPYPAMADETEAPYSLMCSACYTPCTGADAHVVPCWNPHRQMVITAYRCGGCRPAAIDELRAAVGAGPEGLEASFHEFLVRHGRDDYAERLSTAAPEGRHAVLLAIVDAVDAGRLVLNP